MTCDKCGVAVEAGALFCHGCGAQTPRPDTESATQALQAPGVRFDVDRTAQIITPIEDPMLVKVREEMARDYDIESELGRGGMAVVFRGVERELHRPVAIKILPPDATGSGAGAERFKREARLAASLDHPNVVPVYRVGQAGDYFFMAMKFVEGMAVDAILNNQGPLPISVVIKIIRDSANGLAFAHEKGVIHRDIKGGNILIDTDGRVMVADFGIARSVTDETLTATGMVIGTPHYMSPEQCSGLKAGPQSDQYSLGVLAFELLTGKRPFDAESIMGIIQHHYMTPVPDVTAARDDIPGELVQIINRMLAKRPDERFADTTHLVDAMDAVPQSGDDRRLSREMLKALAKGQTGAKIEATELPPLPTAIDSGPGAFVPRGSMPPRPKKSKMPMVVLTMIGVTAAGMGVAWQMGVFAGAAGPVTPVGTPAGTVALAGGVRFTGLPAGSRVTVGDSTLAGGRGSLPAGQYLYEISAPGFQTIAQRLDVTAGETLTIPVVMVPIQAALPQTGGGSRPDPVRERDRQQPAATYGNLTVAARPLQASITVDGQTIGTGRLVGHRLTAGPHRLQIVLSGYVTFDTTVTIRTNETETLTGISLRPSGGT